MNIELKLYWQFPLLIGKQRHGTMSLFCIPSLMYTLQFDGMLRTVHNDWQSYLGLLGYGWLIERNHVEVAHGYGIFVGRSMAGSNVAEYLALIEGLEALVDLRIRDAIIQIRGDAKCVIDQMTGIASVSSPLTLELYQRARTLAGQFSYLTWNWVPRRENRQADSLSRRSFRYISYSSCLDQEINQSQLGSLYGGRLVPLVDLRVHHPVLQG